MEDILYLHLYQKSKQFRSKLKFFKQVTYFGSFGSKPFIVEAGELIKIKYNFQSTLREFWVEAMNVFTGVTKLVEEFGRVESVL